MRQSLNKRLHEAGVAVGPTMGLGLRNGLSRAVEAPEWLLGAYFGKAGREAELARLLPLLSKQENSVKQAFRNFLAQVRSVKTIRIIRQLLEGGRIDEVLRIIDQHVLSFANVLDPIFLTMGQTEVHTLAAMAKPSIAISFDTTNPQAVRLMQRNKLDLIQNLSTAQQATTRAALTEAFQLGLGPKKLADTFKDSIGLTLPQWEASKNYRALLSNRDRDALERDLRDRRFDRTVETAVRRDEPIAPQQVERMVERYREKALQLRAETIARTEVLRTANTARNEALRQTIAGVGIDKDRVERVWRSHRDHRVRDTHRAMNGQVRGMEEAFLSPSGAKLMFPGDPAAPAAESVNCRCVLITRISPP